MFTTLSSFSIVFFILSAILVLMVLFEKQCLALEDKLDRKIAQIKKEKRMKSSKNSSVQNRQRKPHTKNSYNSGRTRNFAA